MSSPKNPENRRFMISWETVAVAPLPTGWRNVYRDADGALSDYPCPAVLLQEARSETESWDEPGTDAPFVRRSRVQKFDAPFETQSVFADIDGAHLVPADDADNYVRTVGPGQTAGE